MNHNLALVVALGLVTSHTLACGSTQKTVTDVRRAPWVSFKGARTVRVELATNCAEISQGPFKETVTKSVGIGIGTATMQTTGGLSTRTSSCGAQGTRARSIVDAVNKQMISYLVRRGYQVVAGQADGVLRAQIDLEFYRKVEMASEITDTAQSKTCEKKCGASKCILGEGEGGVRLHIALSGPPPGPGRPESLDKTVAWDGFRAPDRLTNENRFVVCRPSDLSGWLDDSRYDWQAPSQKLVTWTGDMLGRALMPYSEEYKLALFTIKDSPETERGLAQAKMLQWREAHKAFDAALATLSDTAPDETEKLARAMYNVAAMHMQLGDFEAARDLAEQSLSMEESSKTKELLEEIDLRMVEREHL